MSGHVHEYASRLIWEGNTGEGTASYAGYSRRYRVSIDGKPDLAGTADLAFRGEPGLHNPEDLFVASLSACHMLTHLALCARKGIRVLAYEDEARGRMTTDVRGDGMFDEVMLRPAVTIENEEHVALAEQLHEQAHELCFISRSVSIPVRHEAAIRVA